MSRTKPVILVVEDDAIVRMLIVDVLEELHYEVLEAEDMAGALKILRDPHHDLALMMSDVGLPDGNGTDLARRALQLRPGLPILIASGYAGSVDNPVGTKVLAKPFSIDQLRGAVGTLLKHHV